MAITPDDLQGMVTHWLGCRPNGYLGSGYGSGVEDLLHTPLNGPGSDALIAKLRTDVPVMALVPQDALDVVFREEAPDKLHLFIEVAGRLVPIVAEGG